METALQAALSALCPRTFPTFAPANAAPPYIVWQQVGGIDWSSTENTRLMRHALVQIGIWAPVLTAAGALRDSIESALRQHPTLVARPSGAHRMIYEPDTRLHGVQQDWDIWTD